MKWRWEQVSDWLINPELGAEIGVKEGRFTSYLLSRFPDLKMYAIDPWIPQEGGAEDYTGWDFNQIYNEYRQNISRFGGRVIELKCFSYEAINYVHDQSLDFVFIDAQHDYASVKRDILDWLPKVKEGGLISGHDYDPDPVRNYGVIEAVNEIFGKVTTGANFTWCKKI